MSKAVLISIHPKWCDRISDGRKTIEVRKTRPRIKTPFKCFIYMTSGGYEWRDAWCTAIMPPCGDLYNGAQKIIGEFICDEIEYAYDVFQKGCSWQPLLEKACLSGKEADDYGQGKFLYFWHISNLKIYDKPKKLSDLTAACDHTFDEVLCSHCNRFDNGKCSRKLRRAPQSWCYVEEEAKK